VELQKHVFAITVSGDDAAGSFQGEVIRTQGPGGATGPNPDVGSGKGFQFASLASLARCVQ